MRRRTISITDRDCGAEHLRVHPRRAKSPLFMQLRRQGGEECGRTAKIEVRVGRYAQAGEHREVDVTGFIEPMFIHVLNSRTAVDDMGTCRGQPLEQFRSLLPERIVKAVAGAVEPPDLTRGARG